MIQILKLSIISFLVFALSQNIIFAQQDASKIISFEEFEEYSILYVFDTYYPKEKLPEGVANAYIYLEEEGREAQLIFQFPNYYRIFPKIKIDFSYNPAKGNGSEYINSEVQISSQIPFSATTLTGCFKIEGSQLIFLREERYDPNESSISEADQALEDGDIKKAADLYMEMMYPPMGFFEHTHKILLKRAYEVALPQFRNKEYKIACETMGYAYEFDYIDEESDILADKKIINILANYSYFLDKAEMYEKCIEVSEIVVFVDENATGPYMHLGDSYYHTNKKKEALESYKTYSKLRKEQGKKIPAYVTERINELNKNNK